MIMVGRNMASRNEVLAIRYNGLLLGQRKSDQIEIG